MSSQPLTVTGLLPCLVSRLGLSRQREMQAGNMLVSDISFTKVSLASSREHKTFASYYVRLKSPESTLDREQEFCILNFNHGKWLSLRRPGGRRRKADLIIYFYSKSLNTSNLYFFVSKLLFLWRAPRFENRDWNQLPFRRHSASPACPRRDPSPSRVLKSTSTIVQQRRGLAGSAILTHTRTWAFGRQHQVSDE